MKNYLIIGGSTGIGLALAKELSSAGHHVIATYNTTTPPTNIPNTNYHPLNVLDATLELPQLPEQLDGLIYCPGAIQLKPFHRIKPAQFLADFELQVLGAIKVIQAALGHLKKAEQAAIVLFSTVAVQKGFNFHSQVSTSKGAIEGLTKALAAELAPSIRVNCIAPSLTDTPLAEKLLNTPEKVAANAQRHPLQRIGKPQDIAATAAFLLSDGASWMTGQVLSVDGGMSTIKL